MKQKLLQTIMIKILSVAYGFCERKIFPMDCELAEKGQDFLDLVVYKINNETIGIETESFLKEKQKHYSERITSEILDGNIHEAIRLQGFLDTIEAKLQMNYNK